MGYVAIKGNQDERAITGENSRDEKGQLGKLTENSKERKQLRAKHYAD